MEKISSNLLKFFMLYSIWAPTLIEQSLIEYTIYSYDILAGAYALWLPCEISHCVDNTELV